MLNILVLEGCGPNSNEITELPHQFWIEAKGALRAVHNAGLLHGGVRLENIAYSEKGIRFVDLEHSRLFSGAAERAVVEGELRHLKGSRKETGRAKWKTKNRQNAQVQQAEGRRGELEDRLME